jgi:hypothetical protein
VLVVKLTTSKADAKASVTLDYKRGFITNLRPVIHVAAFSEQLFADPLTVRIEALADGQVVGVLAEQSKVDTLANTVEIAPGTAVNLTMEMSEEFAGNFTIVATNPATGKVYATVELKTDYSF